MEPGKKKKGFAKLGTPTSNKQINREQLMQATTCEPLQATEAHFHSSSSQTPAECQLNRHIRPPEPSQKSSKRCFAIGQITLVAIALLFAAPNSAFGQEVLTATSGVQYSGDIFTIQQISETASTYEPYRSNTLIAVVDDGYRRIFLNQHNLTPVIGTNAAMQAEVEFDIPQKTFNGSPGLGSFIMARQFNEHGHRELVVNTSIGVKTYIQGITKITPRHVTVKTLVGGKAPKEWTMHLARGTVPKQVLRNVLFNQIRNPDKAEEYFDIALFWQQVGDFTQADNELKQLESRFPDLSERVAGIREDLAQFKANQALREINRWIDSGQPQLGLQLATVFPPEGLAGEIQAAFRDVLDQKVIQDEKLAETGNSVFEAIKNFKGTNQDEIEAVKRFKNELESDLNPLNAARLDAFVLRSKDATMSNEQKVSLAISGWLTGSNVATENIGTTDGMFIVRDLIREYLTWATTKLRRAQILDEMSRYEAGTPKFIDAMLKQMLPISPPKDFDKYTAEEPIEFTVKIPGTPADPEERTYRCLAHVPPEYDPYRSYPLILSMPGGTQTLEQNLTMWCGGLTNLKVTVGNSTRLVRNGHAMRNGYVCVAVQWNEPGQSRWKYSAREHAIVNKALRESLRMFSIDSDRVFLSGNGIGADGAYDIGLSHPEHWAGVIGFSGSFGKYLDIYKGNKHLALPIYCVNGQKHFSAITASKDAQNKWIRNKDYADITVVHYIGRLNELLMEEIPEAMKWMKAQRRRWPDKTGFEFECESLRPFDSYFWFYEMNGIPATNIVHPVLFDSTRKKNPLTFSGIYKDENKFKLEPRSLAIKNDSTLWLSPEFVDFTKDLEISGRGSFKDQIFPSRKVILDDVRRRADREHPFWGRVDHVNGEWIANPKDEVSGD